MKSIVFTVLALTAGLVTIQPPHVQAESLLEPMRPTNYGVFNGVGYGSSTGADPAWINLLETESAGNLQCLSLTQSEAVRCYGESDYFLTITPLQPQVQSGNEPYEDKTVHYEIGVSERVGASIRTHPASANPSAILELGLNLD
ncbi:MAG: hypothetical protein AAGG51_27105 [Cyanobacteria bacterium P01_G01_bin.54]